MARFATPEPLGVAVAWNQHDALAGDPVNLQDADGWFPENQAAADTSAAVGDALLGVFCLGLCNPGAALRDLTGVDDRVTTCSTAYQAGALAVGFAVPSPGGKLKAAGQGLKAAGAVARGGETSAARYGREIHKTFNFGEGLSDLNKRLPRGRRPDAVTHTTREVHELKPNNPRAIARGNAQVQRYADELEQMHGVPYKPKVVTYDPPKK